MRTLAVVILLLVAVVPSRGADVLKGDEAKDAKERLKDVKKSWKTATKADKLVLLRTLERLPEKTVGHFLEDVISDDADDLVAERAAYTLVRHGDPEDGEELDKLFKKAKTPGRRAACLRWLGKYGEQAPLKDLKKYALDADESAEAAVLALVDINSDDAWNAVDNAAQSAKQPAAKRAAIAALLARPDKRGVEALGGSADLEEAAWAAHFAIGNELETDALKRVLEFASRPMKATPGKRPNYFGSLLGRLTKLESHTAVAGAKIDKGYDIEIGWWMISHNRAKADYWMASRWLKDEDKDDILNGLRYLQRLPERLKVADLGAADTHLGPLLKSDDDDIVSHALFTCVATGACQLDLPKLVNSWLTDKLAHRRAAALLATGMYAAAHGDDGLIGPLGVLVSSAVNLLEDECWYVQSAALDCLLNLRVGPSAARVLEYAKKQGQGRMFSEAIALLVDLTGQDFGDLLDKWDEWLRANPDFKAEPQKLKSLRGVPHQKLKEKTAATFFGLEINSVNVQFALDRSVSMVNPVTREPERADYADRKADILKRRPEVGRMVRDGFLPRFYVAAAEVSGALDGMNQAARFGITLFNHEHIERERCPNDIESRRNAVNWMLSTDVQGGTDIKAALLSIIEKGEADTILLLSDGEPMSLSILEMISRANAVKRVNIMVVSIHQQMYHRHYLNVLATRDHGKIVDAEPKD